MPGECALLAQPTNPAPGTLDAALQGHPSRRSISCHSTPWSTATSAWGSNGRSVSWSRHRNL